MAIVTISRGSASGGLLLAQGLGKKLGYQVVSREEIIQEAAKFGVAEAKLRKALMDPPTFSEEFKQDRRRYLIFVQQALCECAKNDNIIYLGNTGHLLLRGISHVLRIRLSAPSSFRIRMLIEREKMTQEQAAAYIEKVDAQRRAWTLLLYGVDWLNPDLYDLTINLENLDLGCAVQIAALAAKCREFAATNESQKAMNDLCLAASVKAALAADPVTASAEVEMQADSASGTIFLGEKAWPEDLRDAVVERAKKVPLVNKVT